MTLRARLATAFALFAAVPLAATFWPVSRALSRALEAESAARLDGAAHAVERELARLGDEAAAGVVDLARSPEAEALARDRAERCRARLPEVFARFDALLTPAALGEAPIGLASTGDPAFERIWTLLGTPAASLPLGVQVVGAPGRDRALAAACAWVASATPKGP